jgi:hypothetical protein
MRGASGATGAVLGSGGATMVVRLLGVKRTSEIRPVMSAFDPKRTFVALIPGAVVRAPTLQRCRSQRRGATFRDDFERFEGFAGLYLPIAKSIS